MRSKQRTPILLNMLRARFEQVGIIRKKCAAKKTLFSNDRNETCWYICFAACRSLLICFFSLLADRQTDVVTFPSWQEKEIAFCDHPSIEGERGIIADLWGERKLKFLRPCPVFPHNYCRGSSEIQMGPIFFVLHEKKGKREVGSETIKLCNIAGISRTRNAREGRFWKEKFSGTCASFNVAKMRKKSCWLHPAYMYLHFCLHAKKTYFLSLSSLLCTSLLFPRWIYDLDSSN